VPAGADVGNLPMWSHYADNHRGICLEFSTRNEVMCSPQPVEYVSTFPLIGAYSTDPYENLRLLLVKADVWKYEKEYRLIAQERGESTPDDTLMTDINFLQLSQSALMSMSLVVRDHMMQCETSWRRYNRRCPSKRRYGFPIDLSCKSHSERRISQSERYWR
jgi:hypothetical protein